MNEKWGEVMGGEINLTWDKKFVFRSLNKDESLGLVFDLDGILAANKEAHDHVCSNVILGKDTNLFVNKGFMVKDRTFKYKAGNVVMETGSYILGVSEAANFIISKTNESWFSKHFEAYNGNMVEDCKQIFGEANKEGTKLVFYRLKSRVFLDIAELHQYIKDGLASYQEENDITLPNSEAYISDINNSFKYVENGLDFLKFSCPAKYNNKDIRTMSIIYDPDGEIADDVAVKSDIKTHPKRLALLLGAK